MTLNICPACYDEMCDDCWGCDCPLCEHTRKPRRKTEDVIDPKGRV